MLFNSYIFIFLFLPLTLGIFFKIGQYSKKGSLSFLVFASLFFYSWWDYKYLPVIILSLMMNYTIGRCLQRIKPQKGILIAGIILNLFFLGYFKYANFFLETMERVGGLSFHVKAIGLPLAISFFTFQQIAYLVDCYRGFCEEQDFIQYCLFITFFPQLIAGPIVHHREMMPQFARSRNFKFSRRNMAIGSTLFILGLFKKIIIADNLSLYANPVFEAAASQGEVLTFCEAWGGTFAYTFQLYFDFSGYADMALGLGKLFGINLPINFNSPYKAKSIIEFWRRWHITLSTFLRDYIYIPLGGNRKGKAKRYLNLMLTMLIGGLWHGAGWSFIIWGGLHGIYLVINQLIRQIALPDFVSCVLGRGVTFLSVVIAWVFFRASSVETAIGMLKVMFLGNGISLPQNLNDWPLLHSSFFKNWLTFEGLFANNLCYWPEGVTWILLAMLIAFIPPNSMEIMQRTSRLHKGLFYWRPSRKWAAMISMIAFVSLLNMGKISTFLYFQF